MNDAQIDHQKNQKKLTVTIKVPLGHRCHSNPTVKAPLTTHLKLTTILKKVIFNKLIFPHPVMKKSLKLKDMSS